VWGDVIVVLVCDGTEWEEERGLNFANGRVDIVRTFVVAVVLASLFDRRPMVCTSGSFGVVSNLQTFEPLAAAAFGVAVKSHLLFVAARTLLKGRRQSRRLNLLLDCMWLRATVLPVLIRLQLRANAAVMEDAIMLLL